ncbi:MAG: GvpL/GvpF family gas vesicle protein, partial [Anaerolineales bacterium]|nr:GvpL/GvpF family gas vesicle protein [Anaerolineales bacterium]
SSGKAYFAKKKLGETLAAEMEQLSDECAQKSHDRLAGCAEEARVNPLQSREITSRKEKMVLNGVYLVDKGRVEAFRAELESLEKDYGRLGLDYKLTGPWPPYNFVTIRAEEAVADE